MYFFHIQSRNRKQFDLLHRLEDTTQRFFSSLIRVRFISTLSCNRRFYFFVLLYIPYHHIRFRVNSNDTGMCNRKFANIEHIRPLNLNRLAFNSITRTTFIGGCSFWQRHHPNPLTIPPRRKRFYCTVVV